MKKHWLKILIGGLILIAIFGLLAQDTQEEGTTELIVQPTQGPFQVTVTATGELRAKNSVKIYGPSNARQARIYEMKLMRLVPEGTVVKPGDFVAEIDRSELLSKIKDAEIELQMEQAEFEQTALDTSLTLSEARDRLVNLHYAMEEAKLANEQAAYEAPSIQRQAEIEFEKAERAYAQAQVNYKTQVRQAQARMRERTAELSKDEKNYQDLMSLAQQFTIMAPEKGMVIYKRNWRGEKTTEGATINAWDPVVAELPDLSLMESITYINEVDIQKVQPGQLVQIGLDADPSKRLTGRVHQVANIGEQRPNSDAKVFEVSVLVNEADTTLRPAMTTSNTIVVAEVPEALKIPLETIHTEADTLTYVFLKQGGRTLRQEVALGLFNENEAVVEAGLDAEARLYLSLPADTSGLALQRLDDPALDEEDALAANE